MNAKSRHAGAALPAANDTGATPSLPRKHRSDGEQARERLLAAALRLFAEQGYSKASMRDIAQAADVNLAAISYYFGDKAGLYRAAFVEPLGNPADGIAHYNGEHLSLREALSGFMARFTEPLKQGDMVRLCAKLHYREMIEPTGLWAEQIDGIRPAHDALARVLARHLGLAHADDDVHRLAFSLAGLGVHMFVCQDVVQAIRPGLIESPTAIDAWTERLVEYAEAMVQSEARRRTAASHPSSKQAPKKKKP